MEKEGIKMETHQNWIKDSKKTQIKANQIWKRARGGRRRWLSVVGWWCFVEDDFLRDEEDNDLFLDFSLQFLEIE